ncbi:MAG TPA: hypothetical protein VGO43_07025 [Pyrinomonadaceae bacterium]|nr:hypothetical protein [Pyrinomonadaceae bacterium]
MDFANFTYVWPSELVDAVKAKRKFTLTGGKLKPRKQQMGVSLGKVKYSDVTGDGIEEAIVSMSIQTGGSAIPGMVYVYSLRSGRPSVLWYFSTGDRADGGLRNIYSEKTNLVVELFGPKKKGEADGQLKRFTRTRYVWQNGRFRRKTPKKIIELKA